jgi:2-amino-4-hydroxy-6-hydroxymethyldihydropteridine diphosphokinase
MLPPAALYPRATRMRTAYIALGSNLDSEHGTRAQTLSAAVTRLQRFGTVAARSSLFATEPVGFRDQASFLNAVVALETGLEALPLLHGLLAIERELGRDRSKSVPKGPRTLDLDLLLLADCVIHSDELTLPHPAISQRRFVLAPLAELAPDLRPPLHARTIAAQLAALPDEGENRKAAVVRLAIAL